ncbi:MULTISPECIES: secretin N-terminal domain-containing protein [Acidobacteriaceae]|uniref:secretin N-terminal domain-containing protein n=1 Tax=Acidobacteriaceae TaxID=204434 RepID=UPI00131C3546|nr:MULTISPECIES: cohesin domain-containing protein [Acidobacteriaceae]MDW5266632.1 cohesin domain-containing protein [Edaphobacter sp.]
MVYSPERYSLSGTAPTGGVLHSESMGAGAGSGRRRTLHGVKDANGSSMGRGKKIIIKKVSAFALQAYLLLFLLAGFVVFHPVPAHAQSGKKWDKRGQDAEVRQDYDTAYEDFRQATLKSPANLTYKAHFERMRFQAGVSHIDRGRVLHASGDLSGALTEFLRAHEIDPGNQTAEQEIDLLQHPESGPPAAPAPPVANQAPTRQSEMLKELNSVAGPIDLKPVSNDPLTLHAVEDVKVIYQAIGKMAGLNVIFDPDYVSKRIPVDLTNVTLSDALRIVGTMSDTFYKPVTSNTIFVAQNSRTKRAELEEQAVQTFYLTNASQQSDANEVLTAIRNLLDPSTKINLVPSQNAIVMRATPDQLLLAQKLINDLDRARPEVVVDVAILEVNRDKVRKLGLALPQSVTLTPQASTASTSSSGTATTTTTSLTLNSLAHFNSTNLAVGITGAELDALLTDADTHILQNPSIRATDGQRAQLKIGQRIPIATGSYNAGVSTGIASIGVQTQFTYIDVGVNIDMTPTVHYDNEISLKMKVEVSSQQTTVTISGVSEPIIGQRIIDQVIQLKEGEPSILAGIMTKQNNLNVSGTPGIGELPIFKYFFSSRDREVQQDEIVFLLIPHIVRESVLSRLNTRAIDTGTGQAIQLRHVDAGEEAGIDLGNPGFVPAKPVSTGPATSAANAAEAMVQQMKKQAEPLMPPIPTEVTPQSGPPVSFSVVPPASAQTVGSTFQVSVMLGNGRDVYSVPLQMQFDPKVLQLVNVDTGNFLGRDGQPVALVHRDDGNGLVTISSSRPPNVTGVSGQGSLCTLTFRAVAAGDSNLALVKVGARNSAQANLPAVGSQAVVHVK